MVWKASVPIGTSINAFMKESVGTSSIAPRRSLNSVVEDISKNAQESYSDGAVREQHLVAKESWADMAEKEDAKKLMKHGSKVKR
ncbi:hypothetical protein ACS0TY_027084 [Phlomoides rotata]